MNIHRRHFVTASAAATATIGMLRFEANAAEFEYKWASGWPSNHPIAVRSLQAADKIFHDSNGRMRIRVFPAAMLGTNAGMLSQNRAGAIEFIDAPYLVLEAAVPVAGLGALPFTFSTHKEATDAADGPFGKALAVATSKLNLYVFERAWDGGFRQFTNNLRPIRVPDDLKGLRIRATPSPTSVNTFRAFGASPTTVDGSEIYTAAQTHIIDGTELPLQAVTSYKMYEVQKYASISNWMWTGSVQTANLDLWQKLPANLREIVDRNIQAAALLERADIVTADATDQKNLEARGMVINQAEIPLFKAKVHAAGLYEQWRSQYGAEPFRLLEQAVGKLT